MTLHFADDSQIERLATAVQDRSLPKAQWTHAAHFATVLWLLRHHPERSPETEMPGIIRRYNEATGVANTDGGGYHETITLASITAARAFLKRYPRTTRCTKSSTGSWPRLSDGAIGCCPIGRRGACSPWRLGMRGWRRTFRGCSVGRERSITHRRQANGSHP